MPGLRPLHDYRSTHGKLLDEFNGALPPHILTREAADFYVNQRFALVIDKHQRGDKIETVSRGDTVKEAALKFIKDQRRRFPSLHPVQMSANVRRTHERLNIDANGRQHEIIEELELLFEVRFPAFCEEHHVRYIREVKYDHLTAFLDAQPGRIVNKIVDGVPTRMQMRQSLTTWNKNMEFVKRFFRWLHLEEELIETNPAERLKPIQVAKPKAPNPRFKETDTNGKTWTPKMIEDVRSAIPKACEGTEIGPYISALFEVSIYANPRITSAVQMECANLYSDPPSPDDPNGEPEYGIVYYEPKVNGWVDTWLPERCYRRQKTSRRKSGKFFFWSGNRDPDSWSKRYSAYLLKAFRQAGIPERHEGGPRIHEFRHTNASGMMDLEQGKLEHAAAALGHKGADGLLWGHHFKMDGKLA